MGKCKIGKYCDAMIRYIEDSGDKKGFSAVQVIDKTDSKIKPFGIKYKKQRNHRGVMLNYCPWCGGDISP